jgi:hypothetical protein
MTATQEIENKLPIKGKLVILQCTGAACDSPIFYEGAKRTTLVTKNTPLIHFSSYGVVPCNHKEFTDVHGFGLCGSAGSTNDIHVVARAITALNEQKRVGLCEGFVIARLKDAGYDVEQVDSGFR